MTAPAPRRQPIPFGKYLLLDRINIGGMAEVWRGKMFDARGFERLVAIKRILPNIAEDEEFIVMFLDEAKITVQLNHPNIAQVHELNRIQNSYYIAMDYVPGKDMRAIFDRCRKKGEPAPIPLTCYVVAEMCEGLDYAHRKKDASGRDMNIVHRDISPQNVLISYEGEVKLIDFGIAKAAGKASKTQAGILKGKFAYMSPEQIRGLPLDGRSDVFAVGVCLYELLTGERLFVGDSDFSVLEKVRKAEVPAPSTFNRRVPEALEKIVLKALAKDAGNRYPYASDLADDLKRFLLTSDSAFGRNDLMRYMKATFAEDVERERLRLQEYANIKPNEAMIAAIEQGVFGASSTVNTIVTSTQPVPAAPTAQPSPGTERPSAPRRSPSLSSLPKVTAPAPATSPAADDDEAGATVMVEGNGSGAPPPVPTSELPVPRRTSRPQPSVGRPPPPPPPVQDEDEVDESTVSTSTSGRPGSTASKVGKRPLVLAGAVAAALMVLLVGGAFAFLRGAPTGFLYVVLPPELQGKAHININGTDYGAPERALVQEIPAGPAAVMITAEGWKPFAQTVDVQEGKQITTLTPALEKEHAVAPLALAFTPEEAEVVINGKVVKKAGERAGPYLGELAVGEPAELEVRLAGHERWRQKVVPASATAPVKYSAHLTPAAYQVKVDSRPGGARIFLGGNDVGATPAQLRVPPGTTELTLSKRCFEPATVPVSLPADAAALTAVSAKLKRQRSCR